MKNINKEINWILQEKYSGKLTESVKKYIQRLKRGEPLDYIIGFTEFLDCRIDLSKKPLIPRVETEYWVEKAIEEIGNPSSLRSSGQNMKSLAIARDKISKESGNPSTRKARSGQNLRILDMFAGSGCIGVSVLKHIKNSHVVFVDSEKNAVEQIKINCKINKISKNRYEIIQSDIFNSITTPLHTQGCKGVVSREFRFDYIFANPPYIPDYRNNPSVRLRTILRNRVQKSVLKYEPKEALFGGGDGLLYINKFLAEAKNFLNPGGKIYMEFDSLQKNKIEKLIKNLHYKKWEFHKDQYGKWRWLDIVN